MYPGTQGSLPIWHVRHWTLWRPLGLNLIIQPLDFRSFFEFHFQYNPSHQAGVSSSYRRHARAIRHPHEGSRVRRIFSKYAASPMPQKFEVDVDMLPERGMDEDIEEMLSILGSLQYL
eukprot:1583822-Rhodomonas_salina.1